MLVGASHTGSELTSDSDAVVPPTESAIRNEYLLLAAMLGVFVIWCGCIQGRFIPWNDEIQFADPGVNLHFGSGLVSGQWSNQTDGTFWSGNVPGYSTLLCAVFETVRFSQAVARWTNYLIMVLAVAMLWWCVRRGKFVERAESRLLMAGLVLTGFSCYTCYTNIRYDGLCLLECVLALACYQSVHSWIRNAGLFVVGAVMVLTNLQLPQYVVLLVLILSYAYSLGWKLLQELSSLGVGFAGGAGGLFLLYASHPGALEAFKTTLQQQAGQSVWEKMGDLHAYFEYDGSLTAIFLLLLVSFIVLRKKVEWRERRTLVAGLLVCTVIPACFFLARRFVFSSAWMVYVPAVVCACRVLEARVETSRSWKVFAAACCAMAIGWGLPKATAGIVTDWKIREYAVLDRFVTAHLKPGDTVFCDPAAYFAARPRVSRVYGPGYLDVINGAEKQSITVIMVSPSKEAEVTRALGGKWEPEDQLIRISKQSPDRLLPFATNFTCQLRVLRRA